VKQSKLIWILALVPTLALLQGATLAAGAGAEHTMVKASDTKWGDPPPFLPKGAQFAVLSGDPGQAGPFAIRIKMPAGYRIGRHWHPTDEQVTIIEGDFHLSMGDKASAHDADFAMGDYVNLPAKMQHEATTKGGAVVQVNGTGPFSITYVDAKDDPRKAMK
jgi:hypothetical protein